MRKVLRRPLEDDQAHGHHAAREERADGSTDAALAPGEHQGRGDGDDPAHGGRDGALKKGPGVVGLHEGFSGEGRKQRFVVGERIPGNQRRLCDEGPPRSDFIGPFASSTGFSERYHKLFDEVFTWFVCHASHSRVNPLVDGLTDCQFVC
ncbi:hypothetical protein GCM10010359_13450 [Streptomyces morookaense]|nr:hypothetical protein GCM10010359_13450 [Streptomyces morookaense]